MIPVMVSSKYEAITGNEKYKYGGSSLYDDNIFTLGPYVPVISYLNSNSNTIYT
jgi:hypothetical protein